MMISDMSARSTSKRPQSELRTVSGKTGEAQVAGKNVASGQREIGQRLAVSRKRSLMQMTELAMAQPVPAGMSNDSTESSRT
jgi:hypothetical protein